MHYVRTDGNMNLPKGRKAPKNKEDRAMVFTLYLNENDKAVDAGNVSAPDYKTAIAFLIAEGYEEKDFILVKIEG